MNKLFLFIFLAFVCHNLNAQNDKKLIQLSGVVVTGDSAHGVPGAFLYVAKTGRGISTNTIGYFSLPAVVGDTLVVKAIGFKQKNYVVPDAEEKISVVIRITADANYLPMVEIFPWPTEQLFKEAFLALDLDKTHRNNAEQNLNNIILRRMMLNMPDDGSMNHKYFMTQQYNYLPGGNAQSFSLIDPFAWKKFIESSKKGGLKKQEERFKDEEEK